MAFRKRARTEPLTEAELQDRLERFCALRERSLHEVEQHARELGAPPAQAEKLLGVLQNEGFVDDTRFARLFVREKVRLERWGRVRLRHTLVQQYRVSNADIAQALTEELDGELYARNLRHLLLHKLRELGHEPATGTPMPRLPQADYTKLLGTLARKGYTAGEIAEALHALGTEPEEA